MVAAEECAVYNPFAIPEELFRTQVRTIALCPLFFHFPGEFPHESDVKERFETIISGILAGGGYAVVPSCEVERVFSTVCSRWEARRGPAAESPASGKADFPKEEFYRELQSVNRADAVLYPEIVVVQADYTGGTARWCGAIQKASTSSRAALELLSSSGYGKVPALSILVHIRDMADRKLYCHAGGIEILQKIGTYRRVYVPPDRLLKTVDRNRRAVETALAPLTKPCTEAAVVRVRM